MDFLISSIGFSLNYPYDLILILNCIVKVNFNYNKPEIIQLLSQFEHRIPYL